MKKIVFALGLILFVSLGVKAQTDTEDIIFNAHLLETFNLNLLTGGIQEITFTVAADYNNGVTEAGGILPGTSTITVEATGDWELSFEAPDFIPYAGPNGAGTGIIPIENLGVYCVSTGTYQFAAELTCAYQTAATAMGVTIAPQLLIGNGSGNSGDATDNAFTLHWLMGTKQGSMEPTSMFDQMALGTFGPGDFTSTGTLTLTAL